MAGDDVEPVQRRLQELGGLSGNVFMRVAVEAELAYAFLIQLVGQPVRGGLERNGAVKGCVEDRNMGDAGQGLLAGLDPREYGRMMQRHEGDEPPDLIFYFIVDNGRPEVFLPAVNDAVRHRRKVSCLDRAPGILRDRFQREGNARSMVGGLRRDRMLRPG